VWSRRGLLQVALGSVGWLLAVPLLWLTQDPPIGGSFLSVPIWLAALILPALVSTAAILIAGTRRSWGVALVSLLVAAGGVAVTARQNPFDYVDRQYRTHRTAFAELARDYRAGRLDGTLCRSGFAYAGPTAMFVQMWQNWRAESGTGLAYFARPSTTATTIATAEGDVGQPRREVGDGWWWVA
jgi:hypothetical protein